MKVNESIKTIFSTILLKGIILVKKRHFGIFESSNNCNEVEKSITAIFHLALHASLLKKANFKTDRSYFSKPCQFKHVILIIKQHFRIFVPSNSRNESKQVNTVKTTFYLAQLASLLK